MHRRDLLRLTGAFALAPTVAQAQPALTTVRVASVMGDEVIPILYGIRSGSYAKAGLDIQLTPASSGAVVTQGVVSGSYDIGKSSLPTLLNAHLRGLPVTIIAGGGVYDPRAPYEELVTAVDSPLRTAKDLNGKTVGVPALNDLNQVATNAWMDHNGGDSKTVKYVELPTASSAAALVAHRVDAAMIGYPALADALDRGEVKILGHPYGAIGSTFFITAWFAETSWAGKHPDVVKAFARVTQAAGAYTNAHHAETAPVVAEAMGVPLPVVARMARALVDSAPVDAADIQPLIDVSARYQTIPQAFAAADMIYR